MKRSLRFAFMLLFCAALLAALTACHRHQPGPEATCTEPQVCTVCGEVLAEAKGHQPGDEATCTEPQVCTVCGEVLAEANGHQPGNEATCTEPQVCTACGEVLTEALGHDVGDDGKCRRCGKQINPPPGQHTPGTSGEHDPADVIPETAAEGHYHNNVSAYYSNSVLVCGDYALEFFNLGTSGSSNYAAIVNEFAANYPGLNVTSVIVPKNCAFQSPAGYTDPGPSAKEYIANTYAMMDGRIRKADAFGVMSRHVGEYMYYRTDHHWTGLGAYYAYVAYCDANGLTAAPLSSYSTSISTGYIGTLYNYAGKPAALTANPDYTEAHLPQTGYRMSYLRDGTWYQAKAVYTGNKGYIGTYMSGDQPLTVIETDKMNGKTVVAFKESYGNAFVPYLIDQYQTVIVLDIRESEGSFSQIMADYNVTDVVIINNLQAVPSLQTALQRRLMS